MTYYVNPPFGGLRSHGRNSWPVVPGHFLFSFKSLYFVLFVMDSAPRTIAPPSPKQSWFSKLVCWFLDLIKSLKTKLVKLNAHLFAIKRKDEQMKRKVPNPFILRASKPFRVIKVDTLDKDNWPFNDDVIDPHARYGIDRMASSPRFFEETPRADPTPPSPLFKPKENPFVPPPPPVHVRPAIFASPQAFKPASVEVPAHPSVSMAGSPVNIFKDVRNDVLVLSPRIRPTSTPASFPLLKNSQSPVLDVPFSLPPTPARALRNLNRVISPFEYLPESVPPTPEHVPSEDVLNTDDPTQAALVRLQDSIHALNSVLDGNVQPDQAADVVRGLVESIKSSNSELQATLPVVGTDSQEVLTPNMVPESASVQVMSSVQMQDQDLQGMPGEWVTVVNKKPRKFFFDFVPRSNLVQPTKTGVPGPGVSSESVGSKQIPPGVVTKKNLPRFSVARWKKVPRDVRGKVRSSIFGKGLLAPSSVQRPAYVPPNAELVYDENVRLWRFKPRVVSIRRSDPLPQPCILGSSDLPPCFKGLLRMALVA